ncbi:MAG: hypothetical protein QM708_16615 [Propioniciclava sp.]|uniref:hypothetical protein n=1 Tax=Propioniciclava sp. TaxID=2038686 RepID=UPI0039E243F0
MGLYQDAAALWASADAVKRCRLWRLLRNRGGWDRVRAGLLAAGDADAAVHGLGLADLHAWAESAAARMWRAPDAAALAGIRQALQTGAVGRELGEAIAFRAGLPATPVRR